MQHRSAREVSTTTDQSDTAHQLASLARPELDAIVGLPHPIGIIDVEINWHIPERPAPIDKCRVKVRMRNRDGAQPAKPVDKGNRGIINQRDAIPKNVSFRRTHEQCALPDGEFRYRADAD